jgi:3-hydroxybutyryl-CoA dehydratase
MQIGDTFEYTKTVTDDDIRVFAELSGDHNPVHLDDEFAAATRFGRRIAHGMIGAAFISAALAKSAPGAVYLSQTLQFTAPVFPGDTLTVRLTVKHLREDKPIATLETVCQKQDGTIVIKGEAVGLLVVDNG